MSGYEFRFTGDADALSERHISLLTALSGVAGAMNVLRSFHRHEAEKFQVDLFIAPAPAGARLHEIDIAEDGSGLYDKLRHDPMRLVVEASADAVEVTLDTQSQPPRLQAVVYGAGECSNAFMRTIAEVRSA